MACLLFILFSGQFCQAQNGFWLQWSADTVDENLNWIAFPDKSEGKKYLDSIQSSFLNLGYLSLYLQEEEISRDSLRVKIVLGDQFFWDSIAQGNVPEELSKNLDPLTKEYASASHWMRSLITEAENIGYPFAQIRLDEIQQNGRALSATFKFDPGPLILWDSVQVVGETKTQAKYLQRMTGIRSGEPFSQKKLDEANQILNRSSYFVLTKSAEVDFKIKKAQAVFTLRDRNTNVLDGIIGLLPNENEPGKMLITGQLDLELYYLGGKGRDIALHWQRLNVSTQSLEILAKESYVFDSPIDVSLGFSLLKQDSTFLSRNLSLSFGYHLNAESYLKFFTRRQASDLISVEAYENVTELPENADYRWNQYGLGVEWAKLDSPYFPRRGFLMAGEFALGNKRVLKNTAFPQGVYDGIDLNSAQYLGKFEAERHFYIKPTWGMWLRGSGGFIHNQNLLLNDLFRLGGLKSIRGFNENFFFARAYSYLNMEQRLFFGENSYLMVFADFGILENPYFATSIDKPVSFGTGINLDTGSGVFRFIYGVGKSNLQPLQFSYSRIHFGYLARF